MKYSIESIINRAAITPFQKAVYRVVAGIGKGKTMSYARVAAAMGRPRAVRAVGNALHRNPFAPRVPCHRVIRSDGTPGGFAFGVEKKKALLRGEGAL